MERTPGNRPLDTARKAGLSITHRGDGDRLFVSEFLDAAAAKKADDDWTMDEVLLGQDGGGDACSHRKRSHT